MNQIISYNRNAVNAGNAISEGMSFPGFNYWLFFGIGLVVWLILIFLGFIPLINIIVPPILSGPLLVGLYVVILKKYDGEPADFGMMFSGFNKFVPAMIVSVLLSIPSIIFQTLQLFLNVASFLGRGLGNQRFYQQEPIPDFTSFVTGTLIIIFLAVFVVSLIFSLIMFITFFSVYPLIAEYDIGAFEAIALSAKSGWSNFGGLLVLAIFQFLIFFAGAMVCGIGVFFVLPIIYGSTVVAYRQMFPKVMGNMQNTPPPPSVYGDMAG
jgi:uncharacterized membrane protein